MLNIIGKTLEEHLHDTGNCPRIMDVGLIKQESKEDKGTESASKHSEYPPSLNFIEIKEEFGKGIIKEECNECGESSNDPAQKREFDGENTMENVEDCNGYITQIKEGRKKERITIEHGIVNHEGMKKCEVCKKTYSKLSKLQQHFLVHTGERPYICKVCDKSFIEKGKLKRRSLSHTGERPHVCNVCNRSFTLLCNLKPHILTHTGERPHNCKFCGKSFKQLCNLKKHVMIHAGERPHVCSECGRSFTEPGGLKKHFHLLHTGVMPHECPVYGKCFKRKCDLWENFQIHEQKRV
jgi:hypothetical protein